MPARKKPSQADKKTAFSSDPAVGDRVRIRSANGQGGIGTLIEDYAEFTVDRTELNRTWAPMRRWAIALDSGTLAFADDVEIHSAEESAESTSVHEASDGAGD
ncbi:hypothetical protein ACIGGF_03530 [Rhodococcus sp. NPDC078407]|uniref:hypothetical protein n=1 Tax=Rhodococcus sp. NPDC078407 TaxID=3364509 RepID=UPI0037C701FA